jgi:hypothetical protein
MECKFKLSYLNAKRMKKLYGKNLAREIAFGRKLMKFMKEKYTK